MKKLHLSCSAFAGLSTLTGLVLLPACNTDDRPEAAGTQFSPIISLDPPATVVAGTPAPVREASCPGNRLPDQCGSWAGVELHATRTTDDDEHCLCAPVEFVIPAELPVTAGLAGGEWDKAMLSFRTPSGTVVQCEYRGNYQPPHGSHPESGGDKYVFQRCNKGFKVGQIVKSDWFQLELGDGHGSSSNVAVDVRLGEPDVVGGVVQEQVFYANDPLIAGAALHVPRGSAPAFESFSLEIVPQVPPGTTIGNGGNSAISVGYAIDVHADSSDSFVFNSVAGACPRIELPYDPARLEALLGTSRESALNAAHLTSLAGVASGDAVLEDVGAVTVDPANHTVSFCVEHLSIYLDVIPSNTAELTEALLKDGAATVADLLDDSVGSLPTLQPAKDYTLSLKFLNNSGSNWNVATHKLVAVGQPMVAPPRITELAAGSPAWVTWRTQAVPSAITDGSTAAFSFTVRAPSTPAPMNFCLRSGNITDAGYFGECFSWDPHRYPGSTGSLPPDVCVPQAEVCDGADNNCNGAVDESLFVARYPDSDGDAFGERGSTPFIGCPDDAPAGYVSNDDDCCDIEANAYFGQTAHFSAALPSACGGGHDYDCDGESEPEYPNVAILRDADGCGYFGEISGIENGCCYSNYGWIETRPACGGTGSLGAWGTNDPGGDHYCELIASTAVNKCR